MANATALMRAVLWEGNPYNVSVASVPVPAVQYPTDAVVRIQTAAICGTDLHVYHGVYGSQEVPYGLGHEGMGYVEAVGDGVSSLSVGDYVVIPDLFATGHLDMAYSSGGSPGLGPDFGDAWGTQAEYLRVPFADESLIPIPVPSNKTLSPEESASYVFTSDIWATGWAALEYSGFESGDSVAVFGAGPVGLLSAYSAILRGASRVYSIDHTQSRLDRAASIGAIPINFAESDPVAQILALEPNGVTRAVDCVGYEALNADLTIESGIIVQQMVAVTAAQGGIGQIGVWYDATDSAGTPRASTLSPNITFPMSDFFNKGLRFQAGPVDPKVWAPHLVSLIASGAADPSFIIDKNINIEEAPEYYSKFDQHDVIKVMIRFP